MALKNWALQSNGGTATATGYYNDNLSPDKANNGYRHTNGNWNASGTGSGWGYDHNGTLEIAFSTSRTITEIDLFTLADLYNGTTDPTLSDTFSLYGQVNFAIDYWNGSSWINITTLTGNNKVWRQFTFSAITTTKIRVVCTGSGGGGEWSRIAEIEAWGEDGGVNITTASLPNGTVGTSYSQQLTATGGVGSLYWTMFGSGSLPNGLSLSYSGLISGTPTVAGTYNFTVEVTDSNDATDQQSLTIVIDPAYVPPPVGSLPYGFTQEGIELFCEAAPMTQSNNSNVTSFTDISSHARHLTTTGNYPTFPTTAIQFTVNGNTVNKSAIRNSGSQNPLTNNATFPIHCGWILAKYNGTTFPDYKGLLTDLSNQVVFVGDAYGTKWFSGNYDVFECRSNDRIYPQDAAPAPMNSFKLIFFKFWKPAIMTGVQLFQDRNFTARKWNGDVALVILASRGYCEQEIRAKSAAIAAAYNLPLADVYPYNASKDSPQTFVQSVNIYDPPEGDRIAEVLGGPKRVFDLQFTSRRSNEIRAMIPYHQNHYPDVACIYRNYNLIPPEDIEGYIDSPYDLKGSVGEYSYGFRFKEK